MKILKIGDNVYNEQFYYGSLSKIKFRTIVRVTKTLAITESNDRIRNIPLEKNSVTYYNQLASYSTWKITTHISIEKARILKAEQAATCWFGTYKFSPEEKVRIYKLFNPQ